MLKLVDPQSLSTILAVRPAMCLGPIHLAVLLARAPTRRASGVCAGPPRVARRATAAASWRRA